MPERIQGLSFLIMVLVGIFSINNLVAQDRKPSKPRSLPAVTSVKVTAKSRNDGSSAKDTHCFKQDTKDHPQDLIFEIKTIGIPKGVVTVQLENLSKMTDAMKNGIQAVDKDEIQNYTEARQAALKQDLAHSRSTSAGYATVTFKADPNVTTAARNTYRHLGPGACGSAICPALYTANISIVDTSKGAKSDKEIARFIYYYATYTEDPSECSHAK
jgi:hypothetical protein